MQEEMQKQNTANQIEDSAMKTMVRFFADELLPYLGIQEKVKRVALVNDGINQGMSQGKAEAIVEILDIKGVLSEDLRQRIILEKDVDVLTKWIRVAMDSNTAEDFARQMQ